MSLPSISSRHSSHSGAPTTSTSSTPRLPDINGAHNLDLDESELEQYLEQIDHRIERRRKDFEEQFNHRIQEQSRKEREQADKQRQESEVRARESEDNRIRREYLQRKTERELQRKILEQQIQQKNAEPNSEDELVLLKAKYKNLLSPRVPQPPSASMQQSSRRPLVSNKSPTSPTQPQTPPQVQQVHWTPATNNNAAPAAAAAPATETRSNGYPNGYAAASTAAAPEPMEVHRTDSNTNSEEESNDLAAFQWLSGNSESDIQELADSPRARDAVVNNRRTSRRVGRRVAVSSQVVAVDENEAFDPPVHYKGAAELAMLKDFLRANPLFVKLEADDLRIVMDAMFSVQKHTGEIIFNEGEENNNFYIVASGAVTVMQDGIIVGTLREGQSFGELELMYNCEAQNSVQAATDAELWALDGNTYRHIVMQVHVQKRKLYEELLLKVPFLQQMSRHDLLTLADALEVNEYQEGDYLIRYGEEGEWMYIVMNGTVEVVGRGPNGEHVAVCEFGYGDPIGELEFINHHKCVADVVAKTDVKTVRLNRQHFELCMGPLKDFLKEHAMTDVKYTYYQDRTKGTGGFDWSASGFGEQEDAEQETPHEALKRRQSTRRVAVSAKPVSEELDDFTMPVVPKSPGDLASLVRILKSNPLFAKMEHEDVNGVAVAMSLKTAESGEVLFEQGDYNNTFYVIGKGEVVSTVDGVAKDTLNEGRSFGELELMYSAPASATYRTVKATELWTLEGDIYRLIASKTNLEKRKLYEELLSSVSFLQSMSRQEMMTLADALEPIYFKSGDKLIKFGDEGEWMYIVLSGEVEVWGRDHDGNVLNVCAFGYGDPVGELEFINKHKCVADVVAKTDVKAARLSRNHFEMCMGPVVEILKRHAQTSTYSYYAAFDWNTMPEMEKFNEDGDNEEEEAIAAEPHPPERNRAGSYSRDRRVAVSSNVATDSVDNEPYVPPSYDKPEDRCIFLGKTLTAKLGVLFAHLEDTELRTVVMAMKEATHHNGDIIVGSDPEALADDLIVIYDGEVKCSKSTGKSLKRGDVFGEQQLMYSSPYTDTLTVMSPTSTCYMLDRQHYQRIVSMVSKKRRALYEELLRNIEFLQSMAHEELLHLADCLQSASYKAGDVIIKFGSAGEWMHIILEGTVEVWGRDPSGATINVCEFSYGDPVGELEFLNKHKCVADVVAKTDVKTARLNRNHFELCMGPVVDVLKRHAQTSTYTYYANFDWTTSEFTQQMLCDDEDTGVNRMDSFKRRSGVSSRRVEQEVAEGYEPHLVPKPKELKAFIVKELSAKALFAQLEPEVLDIIVDVMKPVELNKGDHVVELGSSDETFYVVTEGEVEVFKGDSNVSERHGSGYSFGELALMYQSKNTDTVIVLSDVCVIYVVDRTTYRSVVMKKSIAKRKLYEELLSNVGFLKSMSHNELLNLADALQSIDFKDDDYLIKYGEETNWMYIILNGKVEVIGRDDFGKPVNVCEFGYGHPIGELEFINQHSAVADVVARGDVKAVKLNKRHFELVMGPVVDVLKRNAERQEYTYYAGKLHAMRS